MRLIGEKQDIDYKNTLEFFENRAKKYSENNPYAVTMYQDHNSKLVEERNRKEQEKILPLLDISDDARVLDVACGIGRWADALCGKVTSYCGVDFCGELLDIARDRVTEEQFLFLEGSVNHIEQVVKQSGKDPFNVVLMFGIIVYLNDEDLLDVLNQIEHVCEKHCVICIREPLGIEQRLTLKDYFSDELNDEYNAIYRTRDELEVFLKKTFLKKGFKIDDEGWMFEEKELNNRKETSQYCFVLRR